MSERHSARRPDGPFVSLLGDAKGELVEVGGMMLERGGRYLIRTGEGVARLPGDPLEWDESQIAAYKRSRAHLAVDEAVKEAKKNLGENAPVAVSKMLEQIAMLSKIATETVDYSGPDWKALEEHQRIRYQRQAERNAIAASRTMYQYVEKLLAHAIGNPKDTMEIRDTGGLSEVGRMAMEEFGLAFLQQMKRAVVEHVQAEVEEGGEEPKLPPGTAD